MVGADRKELLKCLKEAKSVLKKCFCKMFVSFRYDFDGNRLVSENGKFAIQWQTRTFPHKPESYTNQQTNVGTCSLVRL